MYFKITFLVKRLFVDQRRKGQNKTLRLAFGLSKEMFVSALAPGQDKTTLNWRKFLPTHF